MKDPGGIWISLILLSFLLTAALLLLFLPREVPVPVIRHAAGESGVRHTEEDPKKRVAHAKEIEEETLFEDLFRNTGITF